MNLTIFHYHMLPGGVGTVIRRGIEALAADPGPIKKINLIAGGIEERDFRAFKPLVEVHRIPELDYADRGNPNGWRPSPKAETLATSLLKRFGADSSIWWIHNFHLGKNPLFTRAILELARSSDAPRMILQPHDFPEAGRYENLEVLSRMISLPLYPAGPRIRYALINRRDLMMLEKAGIPRADLFLLENPVAPASESPLDKRGRFALKKKLFTWDKAGQPAFLYPVRAIRRKNVLEAGLLVRLTEFPARLLVTLPGVSRRERKYSRLVEKAFRSGLIPGEFATGIRRPDVPLERLAGACDLVISSSIQEGFGYLFFQAVQWGIPLLARRLDTMDGFDDVFENTPSSFYSELLCPVEPRLRGRLRGLYRRKLAGLAKLLPAAALNRLEREIEDVFAGGPLDFSYLDPRSQLHILRAASKSESVRRELRDLNRGLVESMNRLLASPSLPGAARIEERFGLAAYAAGIHRLLSSFSRQESAGTIVDGESIERHIREEFVKKEYVRLLYD